MFGGQSYKFSKVWPLNQYILRSEGEKYFLELCSQRPFYFLVYCSDCRKTHHLSQFSQKFPREVSRKPPPAPFAVRAALCWSDTADKNACFYKFLAKTLLAYILTRMFSKTCRKRNFDFLPQTNFMGVQSWNLVILSHF